MLSERQLFNICFAAFLLITTSSCQVKANESEVVKTTKPHIVIILADDLGFDDVSFRGSNEFLTPNIDALAYHGRILDRYYAPSVCTPSRAALLTGLYPIHTGTHVSTHLNGISAALPRNLTLMPEIFKNAGYSTNLIGKWNLGHAHKEDTPTYRGFEHHYGYWGSKIEYFTRRAKMPFCNLTIGYDFRRDMQVDCARPGEYVTELLTAEAEAVIKKHAEQQVERSLFLLLAHAAPHEPLQVPVQEITKFSHIKNPLRRIYAAMVSLLDRSVGRVVRALERAEMLENSIIIFASDNGGAATGIEHGAGSNWPLRGQKDSPWEGGLRLPAAIWSPLLGAAKQHVYRTAFYQGDWLPTLAQAAGIELPTRIQLDGHNMWSALTSDSTAPLERAILHVYDPRRHVIAYMRGVWKYLNGTTWHGRYDTLLTYRERDEIDPRAQRYVVEVRNSLTSKALSKFDQQRLSQSRIEQLRHSVRVQCGEMQHACNPLVEECLFNIVQDPCEQNNLIYAEEFHDTLLALRAEVQQLSSGVVSPVLAMNCSLRNLSDPALHGCLWSNYLDEPVSKVPQDCTAHDTPCV